MIDSAAPLVVSGEVARGTLRMQLARAVARKLGANELDAALLQIKVPFTCRRRGVDSSFIADDATPVPDSNLPCAL